MFLYRLTAAIIGFLLKVLFGYKLNIDDTVMGWKKEKKAFVILSAHPSELDATILLTAAFPNKARFVTGAQQLYKGLQGKILRLLKIIPKRQFMADITAVKEMMKSVKEGYILGMMPEGRLSLDGTDNPIDISTAKLIKKLGVPVAFLIPKGTFWVKPSYYWSTLILGKISADMFCLFTEEDLKNLSNEEVLAKLNEACTYNESEELRGSGKTYGKKNKPYMEKVSNIFYRCPACGEFYTISDDGRRIYCSSCKLSMNITHEMFFECEDKSLPDNVAAWNKNQLDYEKKFWSDSDAELNWTVYKDMLIFKKETDFTRIGQGQLRLSHKGLYYKDDTEELDVAMANLLGVAADYKLSRITYYQGDEIRRFEFQDRHCAAQFVNALMTLKALNDN